MDLLPWVADSALRIILEIFLQIASNILNFGGLAQLSELTVRKLLSLVDCEPGSVDRQLSKWPAVVLLAQKATTD
jgi:hypothetical protein